MKLSELPEGAEADIRRYLAYGWLPGRIAQLLNRAYGLELDSSDVISLTRRIRNAQVQETPEPQATE